MIIIFLLSIIIGTVSSQWTTQRQCDHGTENTHEILQDWFEVRNLKECKKSCDHDRKCNYATFDPRSSECRTRTDCVGLRYSSVYQIYKREDPATHLIDSWIYHNYCGASASENKEILDNYPAVYSQQDCQDYCDANYLCKFAWYHIETQRCQTRTGCLSMKERAGEAIYEKVLSKSEKQTLEQWRKSAAYNLNLDIEYWDQVRRNLAKEDAKIKWERESIGNKIKDEFNYLEDEFLDDYDTTEMQKEIADIKKHGFPGSYSIVGAWLFKFFIAFRWLINIVFIGIPWMFLAITAIIYNVGFNIAWNKWWATGNIWLISNTFFQISQSFLSIPLFFEVGIYVRHFKAFRSLSFLASIIYNAIYLFFLFDWFGDTYYQPDIENVGTFDILLDFFFIYNSILHASIVVTNFGIIFKEIELQFFEIVQHLGSKESTYHLTWQEANRSVNEDLWFLNPFTVFGRLWYALFRWRVSDIWVWNADDQKHYIRNW